MLKDDGVNNTRFYNVSEGPYQARPSPCDRFSGFLPHARFKMFHILLGPAFSYTLRQSDMTRAMQPSPATSTTFSCQLSNTLMPAPADSFVAPGRPPICVKPVCWGVTLVGERGAAVADMPL